MTLKLNGSSSGSVALDAPASTTSGADITFKLPVADGSSGQALTTNASGQLAFSSVANSPCFFGRQDTAHGVATTTWTTIVNLGTNAVNVGSGWDESAGRFTCGANDGGIYLMFGGGSVLNLDDTDNIQARFTKNGDEYGAKSICYQRNGNHVLTGQMQTIISLSANDYVEFQVRHNEGSTENTNEEFCWFGGLKLIGVS